MLCLLKLPVQSRNHAAHRFEVNDSIMSCLFLKRVLHQSYHKMLICLMQFVFIFCLEFTPYNKKIQILTENRRCFLIFQISNLLLVAIRNFAFVWAWLVKLTAKFIHAYIYCRIVIVITCSIVREVQYHTVCHDISILREALTCSILRDVQYHTGCHDTIPITCLHTISLC